jgi:hypothetical protein
MTAAMNPLLRDATKHLRELGFVNAALIRESYDPRHFGDAEAVFRVGRLLLRFTRERGRDFLDLASTEAPEEFHFLDDVDIAMGWSSVEQVRAKHEPEALTRALDRVFRNLPILEQAFSQERERFTQARWKRKEAAHEPR